MQINANPIVAAHIPAKYGYGEKGHQGDYQMRSAPEESLGTFSSFSKALKAATKTSKHEEIATGVFQVASGAYQIGTAVEYPYDGYRTQAVQLDTLMAARTIFDDPNLLAMVSGDVVAER